MRNYFTLDGIDSRTYGVYISGSGTYSAPARKYNLIEVPGKNGLVVAPGSTFENGVLRYPGCFIYENIEANLASFRAFLMSRFGYVRLTDTYHPDEMRDVLFTGAFEPELLQDLSAVRFNLEFSCKPQRWLVSGQQAVTYYPEDQQADIPNPTMFEAKPLIVCYGHGQLSWRPRINTDYFYITVAESGYAVTIDTDSMSIYRDEQDPITGAVTRINMGEYVTMSGYEFPAIPAESVALLRFENWVTDSSGGAISITARTWTL